MSNVSRPGASGLEENVEKERTMRMLDKLLLALVLLTILALAAGCTTTQKGSLLGAAVGAGAGAVIGHNTHAGSGPGALIGAGVGALGGALAGDAIEEHQEKRRATPPPEPQYP